MNTNQINKELELNIEHQEPELMEALEFIFGGRCEKMQIELFE